LKRNEVKPSIKSNGTNIATVVKVDAKIAPITSLVPSSAALFTSFFLHPYAYKCFQEQLSNYQLPFQELLKVRPKRLYSS